MNLYQLNDCMKQAEEALDSGASPDEVSDVIDSLEIDIQQKCVQVAYFMRNLNSDIEAIKAEETRLAERRKVNEAHYDRLKQYLADGMKISGLTKAGDGVISVSYGKPKPILVLSNEDAVPDDFLVIKTSVSIDKKNLLDALKAGEEVPGATIGESKPSITIK